MTRHHRYKDYFIAILVFITSIILGIVLFFNAIQVSVKNNSKETLMTNVTRQSEHLNKILNISYSYLNAIAPDMAATSDLFSQENMDRLQTLKDSTDLDRTAIIDTQGNALYDNEVEKNVSHRRYFKEVMQGQQTLSDPLESVLDQQTRVIIAVPIYKNNQVIGALGGSYNVTKLSNMLFDDLFDGKGYTFIVDEKGNIITNDSKLKTKNHNLFEYCKQSKLAKDFTKQKAGIVTIQNETYYLAYSPLKINQWMIGYVVPIQDAQASYNFINQYELIFTSCFAIVVFILMVYLAYQNTQEKKALVHMAQTDPLTLVYNKETTQKQIDQKLKDGKEHCFLILDVDSFKLVNDNYGHIVGDKVLNQLGQLFKKHFRSTDIVGRIGGDEFIVLIEDNKIGEDRVKDLIQKVNQLQIEELQGFKLSISVGIAYAPKQGTTFMELYRHADQALYKTKRSGKNGYNVYKRDED